MIPFIFHMSCFDTYADVVEWKSFPFTLVMMSGHSLYLGSFNSREDIQKKRNQIESAIKVHKQIRVKQLT